jgi:hypothetical protein
MAQAKGGDLPPLEVVMALNAAADHVAAGLFSLVKTLPGLNLRRYSDVINALSDLRQGVETTKINLPLDVVGTLSESLRVPFAAVRHFHSFSTEALRTLTSFSDVDRAFDLSWNYLFVRQTMNLLWNYVRLSLFAAQITDLLPAALLYNYSRWKQGGATVEGAAALLRFLQSRSTITNLASELEPLSGSVLFLFKKISGPLYWLLQADRSFAWSLVNLSDNPEVFETGETFFRRDYVLMIDLDCIVNWFVAFAIFAGQPLTDDLPIWELFQVVVAQKGALELYGDVTYPVVKIFEQLRGPKKLKKGEADFLAAFEKIDLDKALDSRGYRRRRLAMAMREAIAACETDANQFLLKFPVLMALLGWANYEIATTLSFPPKDGKNAYDGDIIELIVETANLVTRSLRFEEMVKRFTLFNLREYDAPYIEALMAAAHVPQASYDQLGKVVAALRIVDIVQHDAGTRYDLTRLQLYIVQIVNFFVRYSRTLGVLHLSALFNQLSCLSFHIDMYTSVQDLVLRVAPVHTYWRFARQFESISDVKKASDRNDRTHLAGYTPGLLALAHYYTADGTALLAWPDIKRDVKDHVKRLLSNLVEWLQAWTKHLHGGVLDQLTEQTLRSNMGAAQTGRRNEIRDFLVGDESDIGNRFMFKTASLLMTQLIKAMRGLHEIGEISIFGESINPLGLVLAQLKTLAAELVRFGSAQPPVRVLRQIENARFVASAAMMAGFVGGQRAIQESLRMLKQATVNVTATSVTHSEKKGQLVQVYETFYLDFLQTKIAQSYYSTTCQTFLPPGGQADAQAELVAYASRAALRDLYELIGKEGIALLDLRAADVVTELMDGLAKKIHHLISGSERPTYVTAPEKQAIAEADLYIKTLCHAGAVLQFRKLLRIAADIDASTDPQFAFLAPDVPVDKDLPLIGKLKSTHMIEVFGRLGFKFLFEALFLQSYWLNVSYRKRDDAFLDNAHLIVLPIDALIGTMISIKPIPEEQIKTMYCELLRAADSGCKTGKALVKGKKKKEYPYWLMMLLLDHFVKRSQYADYSLLEPIVPYHYIRSVYTSMLMPGADGENRD